MVWAAILLALVATRAGAAVPPDVGYQGRLLDASGRALVGPVGVELRLFDLPSAGTRLYTELHGSVPLVDGVFQILVGTGSAQVPPGGLVSALTGGVNRWLELVVNGEVLAPRQPFSSAAFALAAQSADQVGGTPLTGLVRKGEASSVTSAMLANGAVTTARIATGAVTTATLANGAVTAAKVQGGPGSGLDADTVDGIQGSAITTLQSQVAALGSQLAAAQAQITALQALLAGVTRTETTLRFSGMNVQIVNGAGSTLAPVNGLGNLVVGYNETRGDGSDARTGSHNLVTGIANNYTSFGGLVAGSNNAIQGAYASVLAGFGNTASGFAASVTGGQGNLASAQNTSVSGGFGNTASGSYASVSGGSTNQATALYTSVSGGGSNTASGESASVAGGTNNVASGFAAHVSGGGGSTPLEGNRAHADYSAVLGGSSNDVGNPASTDRTIGYAGTVSGGWAGKVRGTNASVSGGGGNVASGFQASVSGGFANDATAGDASVSGGSFNQATGSFASVSGGSYGIASGRSASVCGGEYNSASGIGASVTGGNQNSATLTHAAVSGGYQRSATGAYDWRAGGLFEDY